MSLVTLRDIEVQVSGQTLLDLSLSIEANRSVAVIGPSGAGKTTLLRTLCLLQVPTRGEVLCGDQVVFAATGPLRQSEMSRKDRPEKMRNVLNLLASPEQASIRDFRRTFGMVFQEFNLWPNLTARQNIAAPLAWGDLNTSDSIHDSVERAARSVNIERIIDRFPSEMSGGQRQRVALARALVTKPRILLLDEITSALDVQLLVELFDLLVDLRNAGQAMVVVTHHIRFAERISDLLYFLENGRVVESGKTSSLFKSPSTSGLCTFLSQASQLN